MRSQTTDEIDARALTMEALREIADGGEAFDQTLSRARLTCRSAATQNALEHRREEHADLVLDARREILRRERAVFTTAAPVLLALRTGTEPAAAIAFRFVEALDAADDLAYRVEDWTLPWRARLETRVLDCFADEVRERGAPDYEYGLEASIEELLRKEADLPSGRLRLIEAA